MSGSIREYSKRQEELLEKYRYINVEWDDWSECVIEDFKTRLQDEGIRVDKVYYSGFWSQGDGACFEGALVDPERYLDRHYADQYPMIRKLLEHGGRVYVSCDHRGRYYHEHSVSFSIDNDELGDVLEQPTAFHETIVDQWQIELDKELSTFESDVASHWRGYMQDLYGELEEVYDHLTSDDAVWDTLVANEMDEPEEELEDV